MNLSRDNKSVNEQSVNETHNAGTRHLVRATALIAALTLIGRILGLIRDIVSAKTFGTNWHYDAFLYAFMLPNLFRRIVGEGGLTSAFIPIYNSIHEKQGEKEAFRFANVTISVLGVALLVFILCVEGVLSILVACEFKSQILNLTLQLSRILFPYLWFLSLYALGMGILNSHKHFFAPSLGPAILDLTWILAVIFIPPKFSGDSLHEVTWLSYAVLLGGLLHVIVELPPLYAIGFRLRWIWDTAYDGLKKAWKLLLPVILGFAVVQINITVDMTLGMVIGSGANSSLWYGNRLMQFPLGIFALAMGTALLPLMARQIARGEKELSKKTLSFALRNVFFIILPSSVGLIVLREPIIQMLFERGAFDATSTARCAAVLLGYTIGLFAFAGQKIMNSGYYAAHDSKTPMKTAVWSLLSNIIISLILMIPLKEAGLALATSISGIIQLGQLIYYYPKKVGDFPFANIVKSFLKLFLAAVAMGVVAHFSLGALKDFFPGETSVAKVLQVLGSMGISAFVYLGICFVFKLPEIRETLEWFLLKHKNEKIA